MRFWGVEVKAGESVEVQVRNKNIVHLSLAALGEVKDHQGSKLISLFLNVNGQKVLFGSLSTGKTSQVAYDLLFTRDFELSHDWENGTIYFSGHVVLHPPAVFGTLPKDVTVVPDFDESYFSSSGSESDSDPDPDPDPSPMNLSEEKKRELYPWTFAPDFPYFTPFKYVENSFPENSSTEEENSSEEEGYSLDMAKVPSHASMDFFSVEVKAGKSVKVEVDNAYPVHISAATLGKVENDEGNKLIPFYLSTNGQKHVVGTLSTKEIYQVSCDILLVNDFELSHNWEKGTIHIAGYKSVPLNLVDCLPKIVFTQKKDAAAKTEGGGSKRKAESKKRSKIVRRKRKAVSKKKAKIVSRKRKAESDSETAVPEKRAKKAKIKPQFKDSKKIEIDHSILELELV